MCRRCGLASYSADLDKATPILEASKALRNNIIKMRGFVIFLGRYFRCHFTPMILWTYTYVDTHTQHLQTEMLSHSISYGNDGNVLLNTFLIDDNTAEYKAPSRYWHTSVRPMPASPKRNSLHTVLSRFPRRNSSTSKFLRIMLFAPKCDTMWLSKACWKQKFSAPFTSTLPCGYDYTAVSTRSQVSNQHAFTRPNMHARSCLHIRWEE